MNKAHTNLKDFEIDLPNAKPSSMFFYSLFKIFDDKFLKKYLGIKFCLLFCLITVFPQTGKVIEANGIKTHYLEWGKGENTILLIHGLTDTAEIWQDLAVILAKNYRVIAPDRRGTGKSEKPSVNYDTQTLAADAEKFLDALKIKSATVVGHSFGGNTALTLAANSPGKINSLILIEGGFWEKREPVSLPECSASVSEDCSISTYLQRGINEYDAEKLYPKVRSRSLLILGLPGELNKTVLTEDEKTNKRFFAEALSHVVKVAKKKLKNSRSLVVNDAGHWVFVDQPETVAKEIEKFINEN